MLGYKWLVISSVLVFGCLSHSQLHLYHTRRLATESWRLTSIWGFESIIKQSRRSATWAVFNFWGQNIISIKPAFYTIRLMHMFIWYSPCKPYLFFYGWLLLVTCSNTLMMDLTLHIVKKKYLIYLLNQQITRDNELNYALYAFESKQHFFLRLMVSLLFIAIVIPLVMTSFLSCQCGPRVKGFRWLILLKARLGLPAELNVLFKLEIRMKLCNFSQEHIMTPPELHFVPNFWL